MIYEFNGKDYDEDDFDDMTDEELDNLRHDAEKFARDQDLVIARGKLEWQRSGGGLTPAEFKLRKLLMAEALGLASAIKSYLPPG